MNSTQMLVRRTCRHFQSASRVLLFTGNFQRITRVRTRRSKWFVTVGLLTASVPIAFGVSKLNKTVKAAGEAGNMSSPAAVINVEDKVASPIISGSVSVGGKKQTLNITKDGAQFIHIKSGQPEKVSFIAWRDVVYSETTRDGIKLTYIVEQSNKKLRLAHLTFTSSDADKEKWCIIEQYTQRNRKRNFYVLISPVGGSGSGPQIYRKKVAPLLEMAGCTTFVRETEHFREATKIAETENFSGYDGVILVGGDGFYQEFLMGLAKQTQLHAGVDFNDPEANWVKPTVPIGLIPAGTANGVVMLTNAFVVDVETSVLRIIRDEQEEHSVYSVHSGGSYVGMVGLLFGNGLYTDIMTKADNHRWMRYAKYAYAGLAGLIGRRPKINAVLEYTQSQGPNANNWMTHDSKGKSYVGALVFAADFVDISDNKYVVDPYVDGMKLALDTGAWTYSILKYVVCFLLGYKPSLPISNLDVVEHVNRFRMRSNPMNENETRSQGREHILNLDGEFHPVPSPDFEVKLHSRFQPIFARKP